MIEHVTLVLHSEDTPIPLSMHALISSSGPSRIRTSLTTKNSSTVVCHASGFISFAFQFNACFRDLARRCWVQWHGQDSQPCIIAEITRRYASCLLRKCSKHIAVLFNNFRLFGSASQRKGCRTLLQVHVFNAFHLLLPLLTTGILYY